MDCGKSLDKSGGAKAAAAVAPPARAWAVPGTREVATPATAPLKGDAACPFCNAKVSAALPFCPHCGRRLTAPGSGPACGRCASPVAAGTRFCAVCGAPLAQFLPFRASAPPTTRTNLATTFGRQDGDIRFPDDPFMSPLPAKLSWEQDHLVVRDLDSRNGTWVFVVAPHRLADGDLLLIGAQVIRFRRLGYPGPHAPDADATRRMGSLTPSADIASLTQLRSDGSVRDVVQLSPGRDIRVGRERGEWVFPYDPSMSAEHALVRSEDADFVLVDAGSRNGIALAARGDILLQHNSRILVGDKLLRIEIPA